VKCRSFPDSDVSRFTNDEGGLQGGKDSREIGARSITEWEMPAILVLGVSAASVGGSAPAHRYCMDKHSTDHGDACSPIHLGLAYSRRSARMPRSEEREEWQPVAKRRKVPSWFTNAPPGRAGFFTFGDPRVLPAPAASGKSQKGGPLTACMRKLLTILSAMLKHRTPWRYMEAQHA